MPSLVRLGHLVGWSVGASSCTPKVCRFEPRHGDIFRLQVRCLVGAQVGGITNGCFSLTWMCVSLPSSPSEICKYILWWGLREKGLVYGNGKPLFKVSYYCPISYFT